MAMSALSTRLNIKQPNVMWVFEFWESPDPLIIMDYYEHGNIAEADVARMTNTSPLLGKCWTVLVTSMLRG